VASNIVKVEYKYLLNLSFLESSLYILYFGNFRRKKIFGKKESNYNLENKVHGKTPRKFENPYVTKTVKHQDG